LIVASKKPKAVMRNTAVSGIAATEKVRVITGASQGAEAPIHKAEENGDFIGSHPFDTWE
jgi:hypothetical protein